MNCLQASSSFQPQRVDFRLMALAATLVGLGNVLVTPPRYYYWWAPLLATIQPMDRTRPAEIVPTDEGSRKPGHLLRMQNEVTDSYGQPPKTQCCPPEEGAFQWLGRPLPLQSVSRMQSGPLTSGLVPLQLESRYGQPGSYGMSSQSSEFYDMFGMPGAQQGPRYARPATPYSVPPQYGDGGGMYRLPPLRLSQTPQSSGDAWYQSYGQSDQAGYPPGYQQPPPGYGMPPRGGVPYSLPPLRLGPAQGYEAPYYQPERPGYEQPGPPGGYRTGPPGGYRMPPQELPPPYPMQRYPGYEPPAPPGGYRMQPPDRRPPPFGPRYEQPMGPRYDQQNAPRYDQQYGPRYDPRYGPRYDQQYGPRYDQQYGPRYDQQYGPRYDPRYGPRYEQPGPYERPMQQQGGIAGPGDVYEFRLAHNAGNHATSDAVVRVPRNFDPSQPIHLVIFNHGMYDNARSSFDKFNLNAQMEKAPPNTILVVPEWMAQPAGGRNTNQGNFRNPNTFPAMLQDVFNSLSQNDPRFRGKSLNDVDSIGIVAHSAGGSPAMTEMSGMLQSKVNSVTLLAAYYSGNTSNFFSQWISANRNELAQGTKRFYNFYDNSTAGFSQNQAGQIQRMMPPGTRMMFDLRGNTIAGTDDIARNSIIVQNASRVGHMNLPTTFIGRVEEAAPR
jgi:hypothetical protein